MALSAGGRGTTGQLEHVCLHCANLAIALKYEIRGKPSLPPRRGNHGEAHAAIFPGSERQRGWRPDAWQREHGPGIERIRGARVVLVGLVGHVNLLRLSLALRARLRLRYVGRVVRN